MEDTEAFSRCHIVVTPSDALVLDPVEYRRIISVALDFTADSNAIVTIGIRPNRPETGYGYIAAGDRLSGTDICKVLQFKEKPTLEVANHTSQLVIIFGMPVSSCGT